VQEYNETRRSVRFTIRTLLLATLFLAFDCAAIAWVPQASKEERFASLNRFKFSSYVDRLPVRLGRWALESKTHDPDCPGVGCVNLEYRNVVTGEHLYCQLLTGTSNFTRMRPWDIARTFSISDGSEQLQTETRAN
jgi:hypothetical protein